VVISYELRPFLTILPEKSLTKNLESPAEAPITATTDVYLQFQLGLLENNATLSYLSLTESEIYNIMS